MLGTIFGALWTIASADNFAIPRWIAHGVLTLLGATGSA